MDPLDGTREFVEGRLQNVACLIGIARNNRPITGVIGLPFPEGSTESDIRIHYAIADEPNSAGTWPEAQKDAKEECLAVGACFDGSDQHLGVAIL